MEDNLIYSLKFDLELTKGNQDFLSISDVEDYCEESVLPVIEGIIDECGGGNDMVVDSMVIDLGDVDKDNFTTKLGHALNERLNSLPGGSREYISAMDPTHTNDISTSTRIAERISDSPNTLHTDTDNCLRNQDFLLAYLNNESIPWLVDAQEFSSSQLISDSIENILADHSLFGLVVSLLQSNKEAAVRFVMDSRIGDMVSFAGEFKRLYSDGKASLFQDLRDSISLILGSVIRDLFHEDIEMDTEGVNGLLEKLDGQLYSTSESVVGKILSNDELSWLVHYFYSSDSSLESANPLRESSMTGNGDGNLVRLAVLSLVQGGHILSDYLRGLRNYLEGSPTQTSDIASDVVSNSDRQINKTISVLRDTASSEMDRICLDIIKQDANKPTGEEFRRVHIFDAGLILLHPFLPSFFQRVGLLDERNKFLSDAARLRAVHLLRYMAGEQLEHDSVHLALEKMICGFPLNALIGNSFEVSEIEKEEIAGLFEAVKEHWKPMNKSSIEGIQNTFIQRHGTVEFSDQAWVIRVEGNAFDILLEDLPWEISTIILPWLEPLIFVEWQQE